jgi:hypothetical protein
MDYELAVSNLQKLKELFNSKLQGSERNEATTRFQLIDSMLTECLGWPRDYIETERYYNGDYSDYELGIPQKRVVLEAKKEGIYFELPAGFNKKECSLKTIYDISDSFHSVIDQVMIYCNKRGIPVAVVSNGWQYIVFICNRQDGIPPLDGKCIVFNSLEEIESDFLSFWNFLSYDGIKANKVSFALGSTSLIPAPDKLSKRIIGYPGFKNRNPIAAELQILGGLFLEDIGKMPESEEEFVKTTYCSSGALSQYALVSKEILRTRYTSYFEKEAKVTIQPATTKGGINSDFKKDLFAAGLSRRPIILVGDVGVGKSMFIKHLVLVDAKEELSNSIVIYIDFGAKPTFTAELDKYVIDEIDMQLFNKYGIDIKERNFIHGVYNLEIQRFSKGVYSDIKDKNPDEYRKKEIEYIESLMSNPENHLRACLNHIVKGWRKQIVIFLDNVDQRDFNFQEQVFLISQSMSESWPVVAFVALRPETFAKSRASGKLAAYQPRIFTIDPPRVDKVVKVRLDYALKKLKELGVLSNQISEVSVDSDTLEKYIGMLIKTFEESEEIVEFVDNMSNGNLRKVIDYIGVFVGSAHVDSRKILDIIEKDGSYRLPLHEFIRALIYKDNEYFDPDDSMLINIFDISNDNPKEHFITLILLSYVSKMGKANLSEGFVDVTDIYNYLQEIAYKEKEIEGSLKFCIEKKLIAPPIYEKDLTPTRVRILPAGAYTMLRLACMFTYIDSIIVDTPITIQEYRDKIHNVQTIEDRISRVGLFLEYLDKAWGQMHSVYFDWKEYSTSIRREMYNVQYSARKKWN